MLWCRPAAARRARTARTCAAVVTRAQRPHLPTTHALAFHVLQGAVQRSEHRGRGPHAAVQQRRQALRGKGGRTRAAVPVEDAAKVEAGGTRLSVRILLRGAAALGWTVTHAHHTTTPHHTCLDGVHAAPQRQRHLACALLPVRLHGRGHHHQGASGCDFTLQSLTNGGVPEAFGPRGAALPRAWTTARAADALGVRSHGGWNSARSPPCLHSPPLDLNRWIDDNLHNLKPPVGAYLVYDQSEVKRVSDATFFRLVSTRGPTPGLHRVCRGRSQSALRLPHQPV